MAALPESAFYDENSIDVIESEVRFFFKVWVVLDFLARQELTRTPPSTLDADK